MTIKWTKRLAEVNASAFLTLCLLFFFLCSSLEASQLAPCWFNNPVNQQQIGFIGAASPFSIKVNGSLIASRQRAFNKLVEYYHLKNSKTFDFTNNKITLTPNINIVFSSPYVDSQAMYSYASIEKLHHKQVQQEWLLQQCPLQTCDFKRCSPSWLCAGSDGHIVSVSQATSNPAKQLDKTNKNAQLLLQYISKSSVEDYSFSVKSAGKFQQWGYREHKGKIKALADVNRLLNTQSCQTPSYIFARFRYIDNPPLLHNELSQHHQVITKPFSVWRKEPNLKNTVGAVGIFSGISADGLFSSAIEHAIKEGLLELAKIKHIDIDHHYQISNSNGIYSLAKTTMTTAATIKAKLQDIKIIEENDRLVIYTWLLEAKTNP